MYRYVTLAVISAILVCSPTYGSEITGTYVEARTCQVYTGPCFANGEVGLAGKNAVMGWRISAGEQQGIELNGLSVAVIVKGSHTLGFGGLADAKTKKAVIIVDQKANTKQREALRRFALSQTGLDEAHILSVTEAPIDMDFDVEALTATLEVGSVIKLKTRKARPGDCICSNESAYYPPLVKLAGSAPGVAIEGDVSARKLGTRWSIPDSRSAYLGIFQVDSTLNKIASR